MHDSPRIALSLALCIVSVATGSTLLSQGPVLFQRVTKVHVANPLEELSAPTLGDFDGDGDLDVILSRGRLILNHLGRFGPYPFTFSNVERPVLAADFDGDGLDDLIEIPGFQFQDATVTLNRMPLWFQRQQFQFLPTGALEALAVADFDGDGDLDIALANGRLADPLFQLVNDGRGRFVDGTAARMPAPGVRYEGAWPLDADGDGDQDLIISDDGNLLALMVNQGGGVFAAPDPSRFSGGARQVLEILDFDGDGDLDVITGRGVLFNNQASFAPAAARVLPVDRLTRHVRMADFDGDGDLDAWIESVPARRSRWFENPGNGGAFVIPRARVPILRRETTDLALTDVDRDGQLDVLSIGDRIEVLLGQPGGDFLELTPEPPASPVYGDFNGDGFTDSLFISSTRIVSRNGDGVGGFTEGLPAPTFAITHLRDRADVDGDGDLDLLIEGPYPNFTANIMLNDGTGRFQHLAGSMPSIVRTLTWSSFDDLDGDGDRDLVVHYRSNGPQTAILRNDGTGVFTVHPPWTIPALAGRAVVSTLFDADGDGDIDLVSGDIDPVLYRNDGSGQMVAIPGAVPTRNALTGVRPTHLSTADVDGDGDADLLVVYAGSLNTSGLEDGALLVNDGTGAFSVDAIFDQSESWGYAALVDVDDNGMPELVVEAFGFVSGRSFNEVRIYDNRSGSFRPSTRVFEGLVRLTQGFFPPVAGQWLDADDDGDLDYVGGSPRPTVISNLTRHVQVPFVPRLGGTLELEVSNPSFFGRSAWLVVSTGRLASPLALPGLGRVIVDPGLGDAMLQTGSGGSPVIFQVPVPNIAALAGLDVYAQALVDPTLATPKLTNAVRETLAF